MSSKRVLALGLDGYDPVLAETLMSEGRLPQLRRLADRSARFKLDHGSAKRTGLAWAHVSLGQSPDAARRWAAVHFDPATYDVWQEGTAQAPFLASLDTPAVIFDAPHFALAKAPSCRGLVSWGAHDAGTPALSVPACLSAEIAERFGPYPAEPYIYGFVWHNPDRARAMAEAIVQAVETRAAICTWLFGERLPKWELALVVVSEFHSAIEALWHGIDPNHPLHGAPSTAAARDGVIGVYEATDRMVGTLCERFPDAHVVTFSMHGMGANDSDVATMLLLADLLYRVRFGRTLFVPRSEWRAASRDLPPLQGHEDWGRAVNACLAYPPVRRSPLARLMSRISRVTGAAKGAPAPAPSNRGDALGWMPAARYRRFWSEMDAFALPSFYDGRVRINLVGREARGRVPLHRYRAKCDELSELLYACRNPRTGDSVVAAIERPVESDPLRAAATQADLVVSWHGTSLALNHPRLGLIGPAPYRRPGGHSGGYGMAYVAGEGAEPGDYGVRSAFDVVPTLIELLGARKPAHLTGRSLMTGS